MTTREPRQRWRLALERPAGQTQRDAERAWSDAVVRSGLPFVPTAGPSASPRLVFAAPLPVAVAGLRELADLVLAERLRRVEVRLALAAVVPEGHQLRDLYDVWLGEPGLPSLVTAADYEIRLGPDAPSAERLREAIGRLLDAERLERERGDGERVKRHDLRPLVESIELVPPRGASGPSGASPSLHLRLRHDPALGAGRADEVVDVLAAFAGGSIDVLAIVRERLYVRGAAG